MEIQPSVTEDFAQSLETVDGRATLAAEITDGVVKQLPEEKRKAESAMRDTAELLKHEELRPTKGDGRGQPVASIPPIVYIRWQQLYPGCWSDREFVDEFLYDNPACQIPGYKPKSKAIIFDMKSGQHKMSRGASIYRAKKKLFDDMSTSTPFNGL